MDATVEQGEGRLTKAEADRMVVDVVQEHADSLLRVAHRYSSCHDDAFDAYQRALEIFVRRASRLDPDRVVGWVHTVVKHEALAVRAKRGDVAPMDLDADRQEARHEASPEERVLDHERLANTAEALRRLKPQEVEALWHQSQGKTYDQIAHDLQWTRTKVNRCLFEGRRALAIRVASIESGAECERWLPVISAMVDGEAAADELTALRPHLRNCGSCRAVARELHGQGRAVAALLPPMALAANEAPISDAPGLAARAYEAIASFVGERAALTAMKLQTAGEMVAGTKVAAVAASAAAMAGGGAVVVEQVEHSSKPASEATARPQPAPATGTVRLAPVAVALREARKVTVPARSTDRKTHRRNAPKRRRRTATRSAEFARRSSVAASREFAPGTASSASQPSVTAAPVTTSRSFESGATAPPRRAQPTSARPSGAEFGF